MRLPQALVEALEAEAESAYLLSPKFRVMYANAAWNRVALSGGAPELAEAPAGSLDALEITAPVLRPFYEEGFARARSGEPWVHVYECSTPEQYRIYRMNVWAIPENAGYMVVNALVDDRPHFQAEPAARSDGGDPYVDEHGFVTQCAHCRRIRRALQPDAWDWVPELVRKMPPDTSHGLCRACFLYHYELPTLMEESVEVRTALLASMRDARSTAP